MRILSRGQSEHLLQLANRIGRASNYISRKGTSLETWQRQELDSYLAMTLREESLVQLLHPNLDRYQKTRNELSLKKPITPNLLKHLFGLEGSLLGALVAMNSLPEEEKEKYQGRMAGDVEVMEEMIFEAQRWISPDFVDAFNTARNLSPAYPARHIFKTTLAHLHPLEQKLRRVVLVKREDEQWSGSHEGRGITYFLITALLAGKSINSTVADFTFGEPQALSVVQAATNLGFASIHLFMRGEIPNSLHQLIEKHEVKITQADAITTGTEEDLIIPLPNHPLVVTGNTTLGLEIFQDASAIKSPCFATLLPAESDGLILGFSRLLAFSPKDHPLFCIRTPFSRPQRVPANAIAQEVEVNHNSIQEGIRLLEPDHIHSPWVQAATGALLGGSLSLADKLPVVLVASD